MSGVATTPQRRRSSYLAAFSTVRSRKVAPPRAGMTAEEQVEMTGVAAHTWKVVFMAPLWGVKITNRKEFETQLKKLKQLVKQELDEMPEQQGMTVTASRITAIAEVFPVIQVTVRARERRAPVCELLLCSSEDVVRTLPASCVSQCVWLPLVLCRGSAAVRDAILARLRTVYGSAAMAPGFSQDDMRWMASMWSYRAGFESEASVVLEYQTPEAVAAAGLRSVTIRLPAADMKLIHSSVHGNRPVMTREAMDTFHRVLAKVGDDSVGLPLSLFDLTRFVSPLATVHADGRIQFGSAEAVHTCLVFLRRLASEFFDP